MPTRAHDTDAGLDLYAREDKVVPAGGSAYFDTGVHVELPMRRELQHEMRLRDDFTLYFEPIEVVYYTAGFLKSKSGLNVKHNLTSEG